MKKLMIASLVTAALSGCAVQDMREISKAVESDMATSKARLPEVGQRVKTAHVREDDGVWMPTKRVTKKEAVRNIPAVLKQSITMNRTFYGINDIAERFTIITGIPVQVRPDAQMMPQMAGAAGSMARAGTMGTAGIGAMGGVGMGNMGAMGAMPGMPPVAGGVPNIGMPAMGGMTNPSMMQPGLISGVNQNIFSVSYNGSREGFLDAAAARYGVSWRYDAGKVEFYRYETKTFYINAVPGGIQSSSSMNSSSGASGSSSSSSGSSSGSTGGSSGGSGSGSITTTSTSDLDVWKAHETSINTISTTKNVAVNPALSSVTVTDTPAALDAIEKYVNEINAHMSKQVVVNLRVLSVTLNDSHTYGINWSAVYSGLSDGLTYRFLSGSPTPSGVSSMTAVLGTRGDGTTPRGSGTEAMLQALSTQGNVSTINSGTAITLNNQSAPIQVGRETNFVQSTATTTTANVGSTTTITPGTLNTGLLMRVLPNIQRDGKLMMQYDIDISSLLKMNTFTSGTSSVQVPDVEKTKFMQRVAMRSGETIVMSGFERTENATNNQGIGDARNLVTGGMATANKGKSVIVILLTAHVIDKI